MCVNHTPRRPAAVRIRVGCPPGRMRIGAVESLSDYRLTSVCGRPCAIGYVGRPSVAGWRMAWRAWASHSVGWHVGKKKAGHHRWHPALWLSEGVEEALDLLQCLLVCHSPSLALAKERLCPLII